MRTPAARPDRRGTLFITPFSELSLGPELCTAFANAANPVSITNPGQNVAVYYPFYLPVPILVTKLFVVNGATVANNFDVGIYRASDLKRIVSTGSTVQAGANILQEVDIADTYLSAPDVYYLALASNSTTATFFGSTSPQIYQSKMMGMAQQLSAFALPDPMVPVTLTTQRIFLFGLAGRTLVA